MLYKFKTANSGDVIMTQAHADPLLQAIGKAPGSQGIVQPADMPAAIAALDKLIADDEAERARQEEEAKAEDRKLPPREGVSLRQRAWPLLEMLKSAQASGDNVTWGV